MCSINAHLQIEGAIREPTDNQVLGDLRSQGKTGHPFAAMSTSSLDGCAALLPRPVPPEVAAAQQRLFLEAIEPIQRMKMDIYSLYMPTLILDQDGNLIKAAYPDEMLKLIAQLDEMIQQVADQWHRP